MEEKKNKKYLNKKVKIIFIIAVIVLVVLGIIIFLLKKHSLENVKDSVVKIAIYDDKNELLGTGSGFCAYKENFIVTNYHVIEGARYIKIIDDNNIEYNVFKIEIFNSANDLAIVSGNYKFKPLKVSNKKIKTGDTVTCIGVHQKEN